MGKDRQCCDEIIAVIEKQKSLHDDVADLKDLYEPVQKLKMIFYILSLFVAVLIGMSAFLWRDLYSIRKDLYVYSREIQENLVKYDDEIDKDFNDMLFKIENLKYKNNELNLRILELEDDKAKRSN